MASARSVVKKVIPTRLFKSVEPYGHLAEAAIAQSVNGFPARGMKVIGVTGTDGKTSTVTFIAQLLKSAGYKVAYITTVETDLGDGNGPTPNNTRLTTSGALSLSKTLKTIKNNRVDWLVLETSSHSLAQYRVLGLPFSIAVMTNLSPEHLDYHGTFAKYRAAKVRLFKQASRNRNGLQLGVVNADDESAKYFTEATKNCITYGINKGDIRAQAVQSDQSGSSFTAKIDDQEHKFHLHIPGAFNVYNCLAAVVVAKAAGLNRQQLEQGVAGLTGVAGRMNVIDKGQKFAVIVDYAHTPDSFEKLFKEVRPVTKGKIITVFGSAGRRDTAKRPKQGEVAGKYSDIVIVTEEDDRDMDGQEIMSEIAAGAIKAGKIEGKNLFLIHEREKAVAKAIAEAKPGDTVLLLGKGHENSILYNGPRAAELRHLPQDDTNPDRVAKRSYNEAETVKKLLKS